MQSRLSRKVEQQTKKRFYLTVFGTIVLLFVVIKFGIPFLINLSLFLSSGKSTTIVAQQKGNQFISVPSLNTLVSATNSASITVTGTSSPKQQIQLFINNSFVDTVDTSDDGSFKFQNITLQQGDNAIKVKAKQDNSLSDYSDTMTVTYKNSAPNLTLDSPTDGQSFSKDQSMIPVSGKTDPEVKVTINDFWAITDSNGRYTYNLHLQNGDNQIKVDAIDMAGNKSEKTIKVTYSP